MRTVATDTWHLGPFDIPIGSQEHLMPITSSEVDTYIAEIGTRHHEYDDIIAATGKEFGFVGDESYRRGLVASIIRNLHRVPTNVYFDGHPEFVREVRKRAMISLVMRASQGRTRGARPTGYPRECGNPSARVSAAAAQYWIVHPGPSPHYWFELSEQGRINAVEALRTLLFNHQTDSCLRTLMHCDYMISAQQYYVMAKVMGDEEFNEAVRAGRFKLELRWDSFNTITATTPTAASSTSSLQSVEIDSEQELIVGDHVVFYNHDAFDDLNRVYTNVRGHLSAWRLENAIIIDLDTSGRPRFQGHGYFTPKRRPEFVHDMARKMNDLAEAARAAVDAGRTDQLGFQQSGGGRFEVVRAEGGSWYVYFHEGMGTGDQLPIGQKIPLQHTYSASDYPDPFVRPGESKIRVRRPIESRRASLDGATASRTQTAPPMVPPGPRPSPAGDRGTRAAPFAPSAPGARHSRARPSSAPPTTSRTRDPQSQSPEPAPARSKACPTPLLLGSRAPHYARDADFQYFDFPSLSTWQEIRVAPFRLMPDGMLEFGMNNVLGLLAGSTGRSMVRHFRGGSGARWTHGIGSHLSRDATHAPSVNRALAAAETQLAAQLRTMRAIGVIDCRALSLDPVPAIHFGFADSAALKAVIGGTQGLEVYLVAMRPADTQNRTYSLDLQFVILDDFGVDTSDLYWPALIKFWILQHERRGNRPFVNELHVNRTVVV